MNQVGYALFRAEKIDETIEAFEANVKLHPDSANVYDSLAEALEKKGAKSKAIANYEKPTRWRNKKANRNSRNQPERTSIA